MSETSMHAGPRMQQLLAHAKAGTTPEQMVGRLAESLRDDMLAATLLFAPVEPDGKIAGDIHAAIEPILIRAKRTALDLAEVLADADRSARPLKLDLESGART